MRPTLVLAVVSAASAAVDMSWLFPDASPPAAPPAGGGFDMSSTYAKLRTCGACIGAGYGWCPNRRKCGGFANRECG